MTDATPDLLSLLCEVAGVDPAYTDAWERPHRAPDASIIAMLAALGLPAATDAEMITSAGVAAARLWRPGLEPVTFLNHGNRVVRIGFVVAEADRAQPLRWTLTEEDGVEQTGEFSLRDAREIARKGEGADALVRVALDLPLLLGVGVHRLLARVGPLGAPETQAAVIVAPRRCAWPKALQRGKKVWGLTTQLYALRSGRNWGVGDFTDLAHLVEVAARLGADFVGINPLHADFPAEPNRISPYAASSRQFLDPLYLDVEAVPEFSICEAAQARLAEPEVREAVTAARDADVVDYVTLRSLKRECLAYLYETFREKYLTGSNGAWSRGVGFRAFQDAEGPALRHFATFNLLTLHCDAEGYGTDWRHWPEIYRRPDTPDVAAFAQEHAVEVEYFEYEQWLAETQLSQARARGRARGMALGLYLDLALGTAPDGADAWADQDVLLPGVAMGAPPDPFNAAGQNWSLPPYHPESLRDAGYAPFIRMLRASMRRADALRIDHVLGLWRVFCVPDGIDTENGLYTRYPHEELLAIVAAESHRSGCVVIGEDLGNVPDGVRDTLSARGLLSYRVLYFEKDGAQFRASRNYGRDALVCVATHDLAPLEGFWAGTDIDWRAHLGHFTNPTDEAATRQEREADKAALLATLAGEGLSAAGEAAPAEAIHRFLARTPCALFSVQIEDLLGVREQPNIPGTVDEHPNWQRKVPLPLEEMESQTRVIALTHALNEDRRKRWRRKS